MSHSLIYILFDLFFVSSNVHTIKGDEAMFGDAEHYKYLTNEADLNNLADDAMALTPKTPKKVRERQRLLLSIPFDRFWVLNN